MSKSIVYSNKILDPKSKAVSHLHNYYVCKRKVDKWFLIEGTFSNIGAQATCNILANHDLKNGHIQSLSEYKILPKNECEIRDTLV